MNKETMENNEILVATEDLNKEPIILGDYIMKQDSPYIASITSTVQKGFVLKLMEEDGVELTEANFNVYASSINELLSYSIAILGTKGIVPLTQNLIKVKSKLMENDNDNSESLPDFTKIEGILEAINMVKDGLTELQKEDKE